MSWNELYWKSLNDTDLRTVHHAAEGSTGSRQTAEITGYQHLFGRDQEQPTRGVDRPPDAARV